MPHRHRNVFRVTAPGRLTLLVTGLLLAMPVASASAGTPGQAGLPALVRGHHWGDGSSQRDGNGSGNRVSAPFNSPNFIHGVQTVINANSGGETVSQLGLCKKKHFCRISQRVFR